VRSAGVEAPACDASTPPANARVPYGYFAAFAAFTSASLVTAPA